MNHVQGNTAEGPAQVMAAEVAEKVKILHPGLRHLSLLLWVAQILAAAAVAAAAGAVDAGADAAADTASDAVPCSGAARACGPAKTRVWLHKWKSLLECCLLLRHQPPHIQVEVAAQLAIERHTQRDRQCPLCSPKLVFLGRLHLTQRCQTSACQG